MLLAWIATAALADDTCQVQWVVPKKHEMYEATDKFNIGAVTYHTIRADPTRAVMLGDDVPKLVVRDDNGTAKHVTEPTTGRLLDEHTIEVTRERLVDDKVTTWTIGEGKITYAGPKSPSDPDQYVFSSACTPDTLVLGLVGALESGREDHVGEGLKDVGKDATPRVRLPH